MPWPNYVGQNRSAHGMCLLLYILEPIVKRPSMLKRLYLKHFAKPASERVLFSAIASQSVRQIVEIGIGDCSRAQRLLRLAVQCHGGPITYCGVDLFEAAPKGRPILKYKDAYCKLNAANCKTKLVPGEPTAALASCANSFTNTDLILIGNQFDSTALASMWMYVPRMLTAQTLLFQQSHDGGFSLVPHRRIQALADQATELRRKAA